jgi:3-isopropylmalate/(R)-2-methylmalate dehydratase large subunit
MAISMPKMLYDKLWESHVVHTEADGTALSYIALPGA